MIGESKSHTSKTSVVLQDFFFQIIIGFLCATVGTACSVDQNQITYYLQSDMVTQTNPLTTCVSNQAYGIDTLCLGYYLNSTTNLYDCMSCYPSYSFPIMLDSGRNFCALAIYAFYNLDCALYTDSNPQFFSFGNTPYTIYQCKTCQNPINNLISVQNFQHDLLLYFGYGQDTNIANKLCTSLPLISGKTGGQQCLVYEASTYQYYDGDTTNNLRYLVCGQCKTSAISMDCSFACKANEFFVKYISDGSIVSSCISGGGSRGWDNSYSSGYIYACELYASYDSTNNVLGGCITNIIANCQQYDPITLTKCIKCPEHYYLNYQQNICIPLILFCSTYLGSTCTKCIQPYELANQTCIMPTLTNCDIYNASSGNCIKCQSQYFLNSLMRCDSYKICPNYQYLNASINNCQEGQIKNCLIYFNSFQCNQCELNYIIDSLGFSCKYVALQIKCPNNTDKINYFVSSGKCVQVDINCKYYLENGYCYQCLNGYYQFNGSCFIISQTNNLTSQSQIIVCQNGKYLVGVNCIKIPNNCVLFDRISDLCQECEKGYKLNNNQKDGQDCISITNCPQGQYFLNQTCIAIDINCLSFNFNKNICDLCAQGFVSNGPNCLQTPDTICNNSRTWFDGSRCIGISQTCKTFNKTSGQCWTCFNPYVIIFPGTCGISQNSPIVLCPQNTVQIANQICVPIIQNCKTYQLRNGYCLACISGYAINPILYTCIRVIANN